MIIRIDNQTHLGPLNAREHQAVVNQITRRLTFDNPAFLEAEKAGRYTGKIAREIKCWRFNEDRNRLLLPRGFTRQLLGILRGAGVRYRLEDHRRTLPPVDFNFTGSLRDFQVEAVAAMVGRDFGTLAAPTGSGKTVMAIEIIRRRRQKTCIVCHTRELQVQWIDRIEEFTDIPRDEIGIIGGGKMQVGERITVALVQSLYKVATNVTGHIGNLVVDECHRTPSRTFTECVTAFDCRYMTGLSATPWRRDGLSRLIYWHLGDKAHEVDKDSLVDAGHVLAADVVWRETNFRPYHDPSEEYSKMLSELTQDPGRNALIAGDVAREAGNGGGVCLVLSDRKAHCEVLAAYLEDWGIEAAVLTGDLSNGERARVVEELNAGRIKVLVATGQLIGEGFDCRELSTLFLATPIKFSGRVLQYLGRVLRPAPGKDKAKVYDYLDVNVGVLKAAARGRGRVYKSDAPGATAGRGLGAG